MENGHARIVGVYEGGVAAAAAAARISTGEGDAFSAFSRSVSREKDLKLIGKVLSSGHLTIVEHAYFTVAFNNVSVLAEQLMIEHRLAAYTVKSRRYVDFSGAGYVIPENAPEGYQARMDFLFDTYSKLLELGVPREDARFVLPYCFRSNFIMSVNARELAHMIAQMTEGCLSGYPELKRLGRELKTQLDEIFPGVGSAEKRYNRAMRKPSGPETINKARPASAAVKLVSVAAHGFLDGSDLKALVMDERPRELELLNYVFEIKDISLACLTHFTRHRMLSLLIPPVTRALENNRYVLPETVKASPEALRLYTAAFEYMPPVESDEVLPYYALAGNTVDITLGINARELLHFLRLRTCERAQWEIRGAAQEMLRLLREAYPELFKFYGPSCAVLGACTEGRLSCGHPRTIQE